MEACTTKTKEHDHPRCPSVGELLELDYNTLWKITNCPLTTTTVLERLFWCLGRREKLPHLSDEERSDLSRTVQARLRPSFRLNEAYWKKLYSPLHHEHHPYPSTLQSHPRPRPSHPGMSANTGAANPSHPGLLSSSNNTPIADAADANNTGRRLSAPHRDPTIPDLLLMTFQQLAPLVHDPALPRALAERLFWCLGRRCMPKLSTGEHHELSRRVLARLRAWGKRK
ncbi:hypothetical protein FN846DRAFT_1000824 [Sphaerosporella brunnea]|uniref:Uncharacterized protein n=1 Tax=Sphaerosporella brunnea TaxID=1250544 RepID=A0A5J5F563_9PEZI|nr:hypothetical protein FN846DRAFT_1000824 [Sphaerosporella brunnea]